MPIAVTCEGCEKRYQVKDDLAGKRIKCPNCQDVLTVGGKPAAAPAKSKPKPVDDDDVDDDFNDDDDDDFNELQKSRRRVAEKSGKKKKNKSGSGNTPWTLIIGGAAGGFFLLTAVMAFISPVVSVGMTFLFFLAALGLGMVGGIGCLIKAFQEDVVCGLLYIFLPFYGLYYLITRWDDVQPFGKCLLGGIGCQFLAIALFVLNAAAIGLSTPRNGNAGIISPNGQQLPGTNPPPVIPNFGAVGPDGEMATRMTMQEGELQLQPLPEGHQFNPGEMIFVEWTQQWHQCRVVSVDAASGLPTVHWLGWDSAFDEQVTRERVRLKR